MERRSFVTTALALFLTRQREAGPAVTLADDRPVASPGTVLPCVVLEFTDGTHGTLKGNLVSTVVPESPGFPRRLSHIYWKGSQGWARTQL